MSHIEIGLWSFPVLMFLIFIRIPIGAAMLLTGIVGTYLVTGRWIVVSSQLKAITWSNFSNYSLSIIPLFLLMGQFAARGGMSTALFNAAAAFLGHRKGGVAMAAVGACAGFGSICGSSLATAATMAQAALPELRKYGYSGGLSTGTLAAGGTLGILIPPSVVLVIYAILAEQNIAKLFMAAMLPGLLAALSYMIVIAIYVRVKPRLLRPSGAHQMGRPHPGNPRYLAGHGDLLCRCWRHLLRLVHPDRSCRCRLGWHRHRRLGQRRPAERRNLRLLQGNGRFNRHDLLYRAGRWRLQFVPCLLAITADGCRMGCQPGLLAR